LKWSNAAQTIDILMISTALYIRAYLVGHVPNLLVLTKINLSR